MRLNKNKILFIVSDFFPVLAGISNATTSLAQALSRNGYKVFVIATQRQKEHLSFQRLNKNLLVYRPVYCPKNSKTKFFRKIIFLLKSILLSIKIKPDCVISQEPDSSGVASGLIAKLLKIPGISFTHADPNLIGEGLFQKLLIKITYLLNNLLVVTNTDFKKRVAKIARNKKIIVVPNIKERESIINKNRKGVKKSLGLSLNNHHFICLGRLVKTNNIEVKGISFAIKAFKKLPRSCILHIVGEGPLKQEMIKLVKQNKIEGKVFFHKPLTRKKLIKLFYSADAFLLPSLSEGLSMSFVEACSVKTPTISTPTSGVKDYLINGENGFYVKFKNASDIAQKIIKICQMKPDKYQQLRENAYQIFEKNFLPEIVIKKFNHLLKCLR